MPARRPREQASSGGEQDYEQVPNAKRRLTVKAEDSDEPQPSDGLGETEPFRRDFYNAVYTTVRLIPEGKVASYGTIGRLIGHPRHSRMVGAALKCLPPSLSNPYLPPNSAAPRSNSGESTVSTATTATTASSATSASGLVLGTTDIFDFLNHDSGQQNYDHESSTAAVAPNFFDFDLFRGEAEGEGEEEDVLPAPVPNPDLVPWWRVVSSTGVISPRGNERAVRRQADYLIAEGVEVKDGPRNGSTVREDGFGLGGVSGGRVSMSVYGWKG